jgi:hypothetical protein
VRENHIIFLQIIFLTLSQHAPDRDELMLLACAGWSPGLCTRSGAYTELDLWMLHYPLVSEFTLSFSNKTAVVKDNVEPNHHSRSGGQVAS